MNQQTTIFVRARFVGYHCWPDAPDEVQFLRNSHRHEFHVEVGWDVSHNDRDKEFFIMKSKVDTFLRDNWHEKNLGSRSCEMMAKVLLTTFNATYVEVIEDGENGALVSTINND